MAANIFVNYRKDDSRWGTEALYNELLKYYSKNQIFKDLHTIVPGEDFRLAINRALEKCDVFLVVIGKNWGDSLHRLAEPVDFVRIEIATALKRNIQVIPVLLDNVPMPEAQNLPEELQPLTFRQSINISESRLMHDVKYLVDSIKGTATPGPSTSRAKSAITYGLIAGFVSSVIGYAILSTDHNIAESISNLIASNGITAALLWAVVGAAASANKIYLRGAIICAIIGYIISLSLWGISPHSLFEAFGGFHIGAIVGLLIAWIITKLKNS